MPQATLTRRETFAASHRLHADALSDAENQALFGPCNRPNGHGHNYVLYVSVKGPIDSETGIVMNLVDLKDVIRTHVMSKVDHRHLNLDVPEFQTLNPTVENIAVVIWRWLKPHLPLLEEVKVYETENNIAVYRGD